MTITQQTKLLEQAVSLESDIKQLKKARMDLLANGFSSATISTSSGSRSYTRLDVDKITNAIKELQKELSNVRTLLAGKQVPQYKQIYTIYI